MLAHPASAGHGLNLQEGGSTIIWFGLTWSLDLYQQANARIHRQGQKETVVVHHLVAKQTIDEDVMVTVTLCEGAECGFYKTKEQFQADQKRARERIDSLDKLRRKEILEKYHLKEGR